MRGKHFSGYDAVAQTVAAVTNAEAPGDAERLARISVAVGNAARRPQAVRPRLAFGTARLAVAAGVGLTVAGVLFAPAMLPPKRATPTAPRIAYAEVAEAMRNVRTVSYRNTRTHTKKGVIWSRFSERVWGRLEGEPAYMTQDMSKEKAAAGLGGFDNYDNLTTPRGEVRYNRRQKTYETVSTTNRFSPEQRAQGLQKLILKGISSPANGKSDAKTVTLRRLDKNKNLITKKISLAEAGITRTPWARTVETHGNNKKYVVFRRREITGADTISQAYASWGDRKRTPSAKSKPDPPMIWDITIWVNPETRRMIRQEILLSYNKNVSYMVQDDFRYDFDPPRGVFDWSEGNDDPAGRALP